MDWHVSELRNIFDKCLLETAAKRSVVLFVDALDEADARPAKDLTTYFNALTCRIVAEKAAIKICISARHHPILSRKISLDISVELNNRDDIHTFVHDQLKNVEQGCATAELTSEDYKELTNAISKKAEGSFQWGEHLQYQRSPFAYFLVDTRNEVSNHHFRHHFNLLCRIVC